jgi:hypothetical protein
MQIMHLSIKMFIKLLEAIQRLLSKYSLFRPGKEAIIKSKMNNIVKQIIIFLLSKIIKIIKKLEILQILVF